MLHLMLYSRPDSTHTPTNTQTILFISWVLYTLLTGYTILHHEPWRDEAYPWLIARELGLTAIYTEVSYNGAASLWYYILAIPAKLGLPYGSMQCIHWVGAACMAALFLRFSPFTPALRIMCIFSYYFAYEHAVIARVYMPTILLLFAACTLHQNRTHRPVSYSLIVALLANTSFFGLLASLYFVASAKLSSPRFSYVHFTLIGIGLALAIGNFIPRSDTHIYYQQHFEFFRPYELLRLLSYNAIPPLSLRLPNSSDYDIFRIIAASMVGICLLSASVTLYRHKAWLLLAFFVGSITTLSYLVFFKYAWPAPRHYSFLTVYLLMSLWLLRIEYPPIHDAVARIGERTTAIFLGIFFLIGIYSTALNTYQDIKSPFSGAKAAAQFIRDRGIENDILVVKNAELSASILPYLPETSLWDAEKRAFVRYHHGDKDSRRNLSISMLRILIETHLPHDQDIYFISRYRLPQQAYQYFRPLHYVRSVRDPLWIYKYNSKGRPQRNDRRTPRPSS